MGKLVLNISFHANFQSEQANCNNVNDADDDDEVQESQQLKEEIQAITKIVRYFTPSSVLKFYFTMAVKPNRKLTVISR